MSRDISSYGFVSKNANENDFESSSTSANFPPPRTPLNSIPDPSQYQKDEHDVVDSKDKSESTRALHKATRLTNRHGRPHSESNSAQSTPSRAAPRFSLGGGVGPCVTTSRLTQVIGGKCGLSSTSSSSSRVPRGISLTDDSNFSVEAAHFELVEDPSFWRDRNVQVLIRIRPPSTMERVSQGYGRCLKQESGQTLLWLGHAETRFTFDHVACETISQEKLFRVVGQPMVENCLSGYNSCMFAYGQTGSGKTYTMMGEIYEVEGQPNEDRGLTPRIFEYLFSRIRMEEESRKDEKLRFSCKCSFLEIYNEQITDLLDPSSTNLQLREDLKKGVYVENLMEYNVRNVDDVLKLLLQGASNRRMAATNMNSESSRSHSVFTCIIESQWEKDSMTHFRFARLNLVDLAGSERQKSSGAEGDRLKEAANINRSLSTLGLVIMSLVDMAHGKHRHVPYRDSRLTFLLQDSLGGNSKTTIIANVSPSICAANETLSTLKFAQRAKLIQNNAKVNEDASGDVNALQRQVEQLKGQLSSLLKHHKFSNSPSSCVLSCDELKMGVYSTKTEYTGEMDADYRIQNFNNNKMRRMEATLAGSLRREKMAETANQKLEAEIEQMNRLVCQKEEDVQRTKMMLRFREEKIKNLELLGSGLVSTEEYLIEENQALKEEIQLLRTKIDRNPELTRFALENIRLIEQLQIFQNFYEQGEREALLGEITELRNQLQEVLEEKNRFSSSYEDQDGNTVKELEDCRNMNSKLMRDVEELQMELSKYLNCSQAAFDSVAVADSPSKDHEECRQTDKYSLVETVSPRSDSGDEIASSSQENHVPLGNQNEQNISVDSVMQHSATQKKLKDASLLIKEMEAQQVYLFKELHHLQEENKRHMEVISNENKLESESVHKVTHRLERDGLASKKEGLMESELIEPKDLHDKLDRLTKDLEKARLLNCQYQQVQASQLSWQHEADLVCEQVEMETARTILHLQEEVSELQSEFSEKLASITQENMRLRETIAAKEEEIKSFCVDWERATLELTSFLLDGSKSLKDASRTIENIACSFPQINSWVGENVERAARVCIEKEERILLLQTSLEDAQRAIVEMEMKLSSLKGAAIAFNEFQESGVDVGMDEVASLSFLFNDETDLQKVLANELKLKEGQFLRQIKGEIAQANQSLKLIKGCIKTEASLHVHLPNDEDGTDKDSWSSNSSTSSSGYSTESIASGNNFIGSHSSRKTTEAVDDMKFEEVSPQSDSGFSETSGTFDLRNELLKELNVFHKLYVWLTTILNASDTGERSHTEELPSFGLTMEIDEAVSQNTIEALSDATSPAKNFFKQFEEAHATMKEADYTLNALLKANENAQVLNSIWRQANEELIAEKSNLIDELEKLRYSIISKERENELLQDQIRIFLVETADTISFLEGCFKQMQRQIEDKFKVLYSDVLSISQEVISTICSSRSSLEDICSEMIEKEFSLFVLYRCHFGVFIHRTLNLSSELSSHPLHRPELHSVTNTSVESHSIGQGENVVYHKKSSVGEDKGKLLKHLKDGDQDISHDLIDENFSLKKELKRKEVLLEGLLFDLHLLQESASNSQEIKGESEKLMLGLKQVCHELEMKTIQVDDLLVQHKELENHLSDAENALLISNSNLEQAKETIDSLFNENAEMRKLLEDLYHKKAEAEEGLEEQKEMVKGLEKEILHLNYSLEKDIRSSIEAIEEELRKVTGERDELHEEIFSLNDQLEMVRALADENEAIAVEARQESEASKLYAEQKEEEVQILEHSVEELESTINVLEKKVCELDEEVERHRYIRISLEHELQYLRDRLSKVDNFVDVVHSVNSDTAQTEDLSSRQMHNRLLQLHEAHDQIRILEREKEELSIEIKQCKEYISELVLHSEAQASQYQQKYKTLEAMICELKIDLPTSTSTVSTSDKNEKTSTRSRGSSSPFRCISSFVQQMNSEKDQELSDARLRIEELEALSASRQKEVYMLNTRLAAAESMTHDVIRDLLGVKLDITNYANLIDQDQVQKLLKEANQQAEEFLAKEQEILNLRKQVNDLMEEKESCSYEINKKDADMLTAQLTLEQLQQRDQLLSAQNEMLKMDKTNLIKRVAEMDELIKRLEGKKRINQTLQIKENGSSSLGGVDLGTRLANSERHVSRVNNELAQFRKSNGRLQPHDRTYGQGFEAKHR